MAGTLRFTRLRFKAGPAPGQDALEIEPANVVVLVGPNNSGKSLALREIETWCLSEDQARKVIDTVAVDFPVDMETARDRLNPFVSESSVHAVRRDDGSTEDRDFLAHRLKLHKDQPDESDRFWESQVRLAMKQSDERNLRKYFTRWHTSRLDGRTRFELTDQLEGGNLAGRPANYLHALAQDNDRRAVVRDLTAEAFDRFFVLDFLNMGWARIRMSRRPPDDPEEELALTPRAQAFHREATPIEEMGDGVRCFTGLVAAVQSLPHQILLVDEPEAFLHPPLARRLGRALASIAHERNATLLVATHSSDFLMGCIERVQQTSVVRFTYEDDVATARELKAEALSELAFKPLLRSTNVLRALFHRGALVTEGESDRVFYDEMNHRLDRAGRGVADVLILNGQGKDMINQLVHPLRQIGIPAAVVVDLDIVGSGGHLPTAWRKLLDACGIPVADRPRLSNERTWLAGVLELMPAEAGKPAVKWGGIERLEGDNRARAEALLAELAAHGLFLVPRGELEAWLPATEVDGHAEEWVRRVFGRIGWIAEDPEYMAPAAGDVWKFMDDIEQWVSDPNRRGMP